jgi:hypothetical protein
MITTRDIRIALGGISQSQEKRYAPALNQMREIILNILNPTRSNTEAQSA